MTIKKAISELGLGKLVAIPTETVYGLAAPINEIELIKKIFELKERPLFDPLIVHVTSIEMAKRYTSEWSLEARKLANHFWPGSLTIVVPKSELVDDLITAGLNTVGLRCPDHLITREFIEKLDCGVAAPSANKFTKTSPTRSEHVRKYFDPSDVYILEGGPCSVGIESTIVKVEQGKVLLLRPGMISAEDIERETGLKVSYVDQKKLSQTPGGMKTHYRPDYPLVLTKRKLTILDIEKLEEKFQGKGESIYFSTSAPLVAREIYKVLHKSLAKNSIFKIIDLSESLESFSEKKQWDGIINRLEKAACLVIE